MRHLSAVILLALVPLAAWIQPASRATAAVSVQGVVPAHGAEHGHDHGEGGQAGTVGQVHFSVSCNAAGQEAFTRGVAQLHSFWFAPSRQAFAAAAAADPTCGMAHWGTAMTWLDNPLSGPPPGDGLQTGVATAPGHSGAARPMGPSRQSRRNGGDRALVPDTERVRPAQPPHQGTKEDFR